MANPIDVWAVGDQNTSITSNKVEDFQRSLLQVDGSRGCVIERTVPHDAQFCTNRLKGRGEGK